MCGLRAKCVDCRKLGKVTAIQKGAVILHNLRYLELREDQSKTLGPVYKQAILIENMSIWP
jgi:hypothetical protein